MWFATAERQEERLTRTQRASLYILKATVVDVLSPLPHFKQRKSRQGSMHCREGAHRDVVLEQPVGDLGQVG